MAEFPHDMGRERSDDLQARDRSSDAYAPPPVESEEWESAGYVGNRPPADGAVIRAALLGETLPGALSESKELLQNMDQAFAEYSAQQDAAEQDPYTQIDAIFAGQPQPYPGEAEELLDSLGGSDAG